MDYVPASPDDIRKMLDIVGVEKIEDIVKSVPSDIKAGKIDLPEGISEFDAGIEIKKLALLNRDLDHYISFLGAGAYDHFIPAVVPGLASRSEFVTAYTPYQPEASQGTLQAIFEYQSMICEITGLDVANASLYDGGSACAEAAMMIVNAHPGKKELLVAESVHPYYKTVIRTYLENIDVKIKIVPSDKGVINPQTLDSFVSCDTAGMIVQSPNFFGCIEDVKILADKIHNVGGSLAMACNPISLGILSSPGELGADIAIGEGQPLGVDLCYGGPYFGFISCRENLMRKLPGRIVGATLDHNNKRCFVLTLQAREQHIRREKATSNICSNQALMALRGCIYLCWLGKEGFFELSKQNSLKAHYAAKLACGIKGVSLAFDTPFFNEFCLRIESGINLKDIIDRTCTQKVFAGVEIRQLDANLPDLLLVSVTEKRTGEEINKWVQVLDNAINSK